MGNQYSILEAYRHNKPLMEKYLEMNGFTALEVQNDYTEGLTNRREWSVREIWKDGIGVTTAEGFTRKCDAVAYAKYLSEISGLEFRK